MTSKIQIKDETVNTIVELADAELENLAGAGEWGVGRRTPRA